MADEPQDRAGAEAEAPITGFDHVGIQVRDVERSARFYEEMLGFERVGRWSRSEAYVQRVVGYEPDVVLEIAMLAMPGSDFYLEILEYRGVDGTPVDPDTANPGTAHFCLLVDDLEELHSRLAARGVEFVSAPQVATAGPIEGGRVVYMLDPDGIRVELIERPDGERGGGWSRRYGQGQRDA